MLLKLENESGKLVFDNVYFEAFVIFHANDFRTQLHRAQLGEKGTFCITVMMMMRTMRMTMICNLWKMAEVSVKVRYCQSSKGDICKDAATPEFHWFYILIGPPREILAGIGYTAGPGQDFN